MANTRHSNSVIKVGGSLLGWSDLPRALERECQPIAGTQVFVFGGGRFVEEIRFLDRVRSLGDETAHWLSVDAMGWTARLGADFLPAARQVSQIEAIVESTQKGECRQFVFECGAWLRDCDAAQVPWLEKSWRFTADSIALALAQELEAEQLLLLKSSLPDRVHSLTGAIAEGLIDPAFAQTWYRNRIPESDFNLSPKSITITNLRADPIQKRSLILKQDRLESGESSP